MITDWDDAYANGPHIPGAEGYVSQWESRSARFRGAHPAARHRVLRHGPAPREESDLFLPEAEPRGLFVFIHGGYWRSMHRSMWSHLAAGALARGWAVAIPGYTLCPDARIGAITREIEGALDMAARELDGPVVIAGHSAGGHLAARMGCADLAPECAARIERIVPISGLADLRPLMRTAMNADLRLDLDEARRESPALLEPRGGFDLTCWVGANERPEFLRQNALLANVWTGMEIETRQVEARGHHHFSVIADLEDPRSALCETLFGDGLR